MRIEAWTVYFEVDESKKRSFSDQQVTEKILKDVFEGTQSVAALGVKVYEAQFLDVENP